MGNLLIEKGLDVVALNVSTRDFSQVEKTTEESIAPLGLALLLTLAAKKGFQGELVDMEAGKLTPKQVGDAINESTPRHVAMNVLSPNVSTGLAVARLIDQDVLLILGAAHATALPERTLHDFCQVHPKTTVVAGGAGMVENSFIDLLDGQNNKDLAGVWWQENGETRQPLKLATRIPFQSLPQIDRSFIKHEPYFDTRIRKRESTMITSINCPCDCSFCFGSRYVSGAKTEHRTDEQIMDEVDYLVTGLGSESIRVDDDLLIGPRRHLPRLMEIWDGLSRRQVTWRANGRANMIDSYVPKDVVQLASIGLMEVALGIESGVARLLKQINKGINLDQVENSIKKLVEAGILSKGYFIVGIPGETADETKETFNFARKLRKDFGKLFRAQIFTFRAYPGTRDWHNLRKSGWSEVDLLAMEAKASGARPQTEIITNAQFAELHPAVLARMIEDYDMWQVSR